MELLTQLDREPDSQSNLLKHLPDEMQRCIQSCVSCHEICEQMVGHCLEMGGEHAAPDHIRLLRDCAQICQVSAAFMLRGSEFHMRTCGACAEICQACAQDCERMAGDDEMMRMCAEICRRCAESCENMSAPH